MNTQRIFWVAFMAVTPSLAWGQIGVVPGNGIGLDPRVQQNPQVDANVPFSGQRFDDRIPAFGNSLPQGIFREFGHDFQDFDGTTGSINRFNPGASTFDPLAGLSREEIDARGGFARDQGLGTGRRAFGVGTGSGNQAAGFGAYNYGTTAGLGLMYSGLGDYYSGQGNYLRGAGDYEYSSSLADVKDEEAKYLGYKNEETAASTFFNKRHINLEGQKYEKELRKSMYDFPSTEELARYNRLREPRSLKPEQYDQFTGRVIWPELLEHPVFGEEREVLNNLLEDRVEARSDAGIGSANYHEVREAAAEMKAELKENIEELAPQEYIEAKKFIEGVEKKAQESPEAEVPASDLFTP